MRTALAAFLAATVLTFAPAEANPDPVNIPAHTHFIRAGELVDPYYIGRQFKWHEAGCRYRDCPWHRIDSVGHFDIGYDPEYGGGPRVAVHFRGGSGVVMLDSTRVLVRGAP